MSSVDVAEQKVEQWRANLRAIVSAGGSGFKKLLREEIEITPAWMDRILASAAINQRIQFSICEAFGINNDTMSSPMRKDMHRHIAEKFLKTHS